MDGCDKYRPAKNRVLGVAIAAIERHCWRLGASLGAGWNLNQSSGEWS